MGLVKIRDATITVGSHTLIVGDGSLGWSEKSPNEYKPLRGVFANAAASITEADTIVKADEEPMDVNFSFVLKAYTGTYAEILAAIKGETTSDCGAPYSDITFTLDSCPAGSTGGDTFTYPFTYFRWENIGGDITAGRITVSGKCQWANYEAMVA